MVQNLPQESRCWGSAGSLAGASEAPGKEEKGMALLAFLRAEPLTCCQAGEAGLPESGFQGGKNSRSLCAWATSRRAAHSAQICPLFLLLHERWPVCTLSRPLEIVPLVCRPAPSAVRYYRYHYPSGLAGCVACFLTLCCYKRCRSE